MLRLLIVEDNEEQIKLYKDAIDEFNVDSDIKINIEIGNTLEKGLKLIKTKDFDAAIIDLILGSDDKEGRGNQVLRKIRENLRFPVRIITGYPQDIDEDLKKENIFWKIYRRTDVNNEEIFDKIVKIYRTGILKILGNRGQIEKYLKKIFWDHLAEHFDEIIKYSQDDAIEKILLRCISAYLIEYMDIGSTGSGEIYIPPEFYIKPPVRSHFFTGDLLKNKSTEEIFVILTPACDMVIRKSGNDKEFRNAEKFLSAQLILWKDLNYVSSKGENKGKFSELLSDNDIKNTFKEYMKNKKERYHFIPPYKDIPASFIDFQSVISLSGDKINEDYERIATISGAFVRDIIARFSRYYARQGQPDLDVKKILGEILVDGDSE